jgi:hypothetical protein
VLFDSLAAAEDFASNVRGNAANQAANGVTLVSFDVTTSPESAWHRRAEPEGFRGGRVHHCVRRRSLPIVAAGKPGASPAGRTTTSGDSTALMDAIAHTVGSWPYLGAAPARGIDLRCGRAVGTS